MMVWRLLAPFQFPLLLINYTNNVLALMYMEFKEFEVKDLQEVSS